MRQFAAVLSMVVLTGVCFAEEAVDTGTLTVNVINGTASGSSVEGAEVILALFDGQDEVGHKTAVAAADGKVSFKVVTGMNYGAVVQAKHNDMLFSSDPIRLTPGQKVFTDTVVVYDVLPDNTALKIGYHHIIVKVQLNTIAVQEYIQIINPTDKAVTASRKDSEDRPIVLDMKLPKGYRDIQCIQYFHPQAIVQNKSGFYDTMAVPPGEYDASFSYVLDIESSKLDFVKLITTPTSNVIVVTKLAGATVKGLAGQGDDVTLESQGDGKYYMLDKTFEPGQAIEFKITGLKGKSQDHLLVIFSGVFAVLVLGVIFRMRPKKK